MIKTKVNPKNTLTLTDVENGNTTVHDVKPGCLLTWRPLETLMRKSQNWQSSCVRAAPAYTHLLQLSRLEQQEAAAVSVLSSMRGALKTENAGSSGGSNHHHTQVAARTQGPAAWRTPASPSKVLSKAQQPSSPSQPLLWRGGTARVVPRLSALSAARLWQCAVTCCSARAEILS